MRNLAAYFAAESPTSPRTASDPEKVSAGRRASAAYFCESCHRPGFVGQNQAPRWWWWELEQ
jgi:cytochrome c553